MATDKIIIFKDVWDEPSIKEFIERMKSERAIKMTTSDTSITIVGDNLDEHIEGLKHLYHSLDEKTRQELYEKYGIEVN